MRRFVYNGYGEYSLTKREEEAITKAFAGVARLGSLRKDQRIVIERFADLWFNGKHMNFDKGKLGHAFLDLCDAEKVKIAYMSKIGNDGPMQLVQFRDRLERYERRDASVRRSYGGMYSGWGSHWKDGTQEKRRDFREKVLATWLIHTGYRRDQLVPWVQTHTQRLEAEVASLRAMLLKSMDKPMPLTIDDLRHRFKDKVFHSDDGETVH